MKYRVQANTKKKSRRGRGCLCCTISTKGKSQDNEDKITGKVRSENQKISKFFEVLKLPNPSGRTAALGLTVSQLSKFL